MCVRVVLNMTGIECYCGDTVRPDAQKAPASDCNAPCRGYSGNETCGGVWRISVFAVDCSDPPVPPPPELPYYFNPCRNASNPFVSMPFCNASLPIDQRVADAVSRLTLAEKIANLGYIAAAPSLVRTCTTRVCIYICIYVCVCVCVYHDVCVYVYVYMCACLSLYIRIAAVHSIFRHTYMAYAPFSLVI